MIDDSYEGGRKIDYSPLVFNFTELRNRVHRFFWENYWSSSTTVREATDFLKLDLSPLDITSQANAHEELWRNAPRTVELLHGVFASLDEVQSRLMIAPPEDEGLFRKGALVLAENFDRLVRSMDERILVIENHFLEAIVRADNGRRALSNRSWNPPADSVIVAAEARDELYESWTSAKLRAYLTVADSITNLPSYRLYREAAPTQHSWKELSEEAVQLLRDDLETELLWLESNGK